ncbi:uncharacterized protein LOC135983285 isoform X6 [Chrysemys picta bellii]|uniref:uncharacterized protein LOC135983285 isoform X6 n=1 Tax=Chrysemys picta bellii TaxID=8478 RepID=UPI0032B10BFB
MAWAEGTASGWVGGWALVPLGGCLLLCGLCRRKLPVFPTSGPQPRDSPPELGPRYISDPTAGTSVAASPRPPVGPRSTDNEDEDDFQYPPAPWTESRQTPVFEPLKQARESGTDVDSHGSYVNISSVEKDKEYLEVLPLGTERTGPHRQKGPSHNQASLDEQKADYDYVNVP